MVSPRPSWVSFWVSTITLPPSCCMPASNDTRVRVEGFSKIIARVLPSSGRAGTPSPRLKALPLSIRLRKSEPSTRSRSRKCRISVMTTSDRQFCADAANDVEGLGDFALVDDQRRDEADIVVAGPHGQQAVIEHPGGDFGVGRHGFQAEHQALAAHLRIDLGEFGDRRFQPGFQLVADLD